MLTTCDAYYVCFVWSFLGLPAAASNRSIACIEMEEWTALDGVGHL